MVSRHGASRDKTTDSDRKAGCTAAGVVGEGTGRSYFSPAPQAEPHAAGLGSGFSSPAPQAEPHAPEGVSVAA